MTVAQKQLTSPEARLEQVPQPALLFYQSALSVTPSQMPGGLQGGTSPPVPESLGSAFPGRPTA
jgi:hypothetical protein